MSLTCGCGDWDGDNPEYWWSPDEDYSELKTRRSRKCRSCGAKISVGSTVLRFARWRETESDIEIKILGEGEEVPLADWYHCEACADQYFNLTELGFCVQPADDVRELLKEYAEMAAEEQAAKTIPNREQA